MRDLHLMIDVMTLPIVDGIFAGCVASYDQGENLHGAYGFHSVEPQFWLDRGDLVCSVGRIWQNRYEVGGKTCCSIDLVAECLSVLTKAPADYW